ncbi:MAG: threonine-phosphate decarboxylase CobD [Rhizobiaceae bacterium]
MVPRPETTGSFPGDHGGSLDHARALFADAPEPWIDLSTGINPHSYPVFELPAKALTRLPEPGRVARLAALAAAAYEARSPDHVVVSPGTQPLLPLIAGLRPAGLARILGPTYSEHGRCAALAGHRVETVPDPALLAEADLGVVVNPNNPDGRLIEADDLRTLAQDLERHGGLLLVDEAFMDVAPQGHSLAGDLGAGNIVVLKSFGKFYGLAGLRLSFAIATEAVADRLRAALGPWPVSGPALEYGLCALADRDWQIATRKQIFADAERLAALLTGSGLESVGGTGLFRLVRHEEAGMLFSHLGRAGILARAFADRPQCLRFGLPGGDAEWRRLNNALVRWMERAA